MSAEEEDKELLQQFDINLDEEELQEDEDLEAASAGRHRHGPCRPR